jgi:NAD(P)-dependent dehydrogenase (short-subunit alcohol dehydrogenase family)
MEKEFNAWVEANVSSQKGKTALVTGANTGIGYFTALALAQKGAKVIVAGRDAEKVSAAIAHMKEDGALGDLEPGIVDLASMASVKRFAEEVKSKHKSLDLLINNAGVMMPPASKTEDGFELQFGTNHIGHFLLSGLLYPLLKAKKGSRLVAVSSIAHRGGVIDFENFHLEKEYDRRREYYQSKLANLMFSLELARRIERAGDEVISLACHPGITKSELQRHLPAEVFANFSFMETWQGALPTIVAATKEDVKPKQYYGPDGPQEHGGWPAPAVISEHAKDEKVAHRLWKESEDITGVSFP